VTTFPSDVAGPPFEPTRLTRARRATTVAFVLLGVVQGSLASRMPALKVHAGLSDSLLGLALLGIPAGSILAAQVTGPWMARRGSSPVIVAGGALMCVALVAPAYAPNFPTFLGAMTLLGFGIGLTDTAMNAHAVVVESAYARPIMSSFHAFVSLGNLLGATIGAAAAWVLIAPQLQFPVVTGLALVVGVLSRGALLPATAEVSSSEPLEAGRPPRGTGWTRTLVLLAGVALLAWMTEHAIADWSAVYLRDQLSAPGDVATYGYVVFTALMVMTRFVSDRTVARFGTRHVLRWGGFIAGGGLAVGLTTATVAGTVVGCGLVGIGMAGVVPIVFTAAGNSPGVSASYAVSKVAGVAFAGSLLGPPLIGFTAALTSLRTALFLVAAAALLIGLLGPRAVRTETGPSALTSPVE
jgi:MFS family permease